MNIRTARTQRAMMFAGLIALMTSQSQHASAQSAADRPVIERVAPLAAARGKHDVRVEQDVMIRMRDGVHLATDLYMPERLPGRLPAILIRTPYDKNRPQAEAIVPARLLASHGYVVAVQDVRGKFRSEGVFSVGGGDATDGYDTVAWLAERSWSSGKIGTYGCSYLGQAQILSAQLRHPALRTMIAGSSGGAVGSTGGRYRYLGARNGGAFELAGAIKWFTRAGYKHASQQPQTLPNVDIRKEAARLPVADILDQLGIADTDWRDFASRESADPWWNQFGYMTDQSKIDVPTLFVNSWYDYGVAETIQQFEHVARTAPSERARRNQFLIISPADHCESEQLPADAFVRGRSMGDPRLDYFNIYLQWFDHWLRDADNDVPRMPKVRYFLMGANQWKSAQQWPPAGTQVRALHLDSGGRANSRFGDGQLSWQPPKQAAADTFTYDPATPVPSLGGPLCCSGAYDPPGRPFDQSEIETRHDVLVYTTAPLTRGIEVSGPIKVELHVSSDAPDTDFTAKLVHVLADGRAFNIQEGILRARYREGQHQQLRMKPGAVYPLSIDLQATSNYFTAGDRIRLEISSSNFPRFDRNLNTGGRNFDETTPRVARNTVHHSPRAASQLLIPVVGEEP